MAEVLVEFSGSLTGSDGKVYTARACGTERADGLWEGWLEFTAAGAGTVVRTARETTQPNRDDCLYWATGLTITYLEGALERTLEPVSPIRVREAANTPPAYDQPAPSRAAPEPAPRATPEPVAILDPFAVYAEGEELLQQQLLALDEPKIRNIIRYYRLADDATTDSAVGRRELAALVMEGVRKRGT